MNCEKCQELVSDFLDGTLAIEDQALFNQHLGACLSCADVRDEMQAIVGVAHAERGQHASPPNERALRLRIRNTVEAERDADRRAARVSAGTHESFWARLMGKRWELSLPQMTMAVAATVASVSLVTTLGVRSFRDRQTMASEASSSQTAGSQPREVVMDSFYRRGFVRKVDIDYLNQRVDQRKANWNPQMRAAFDRSMIVIDQVVSDSLSELEHNPQDEVSEEMLNAALRDKMKLLQEFSEY